MKAGFQTGYMKTIELHKTITDSNDRDAGLLREQLSSRGILLVNIMSSAGSGKTTLLLRIIKDLRDKADIYVLEADIASDVDARSVEAAGAESIQVHTDGMCHMDAGMTKTALEGLVGLSDSVSAASGSFSRPSPKTSEKGDFRPSIVFLENVGNLICPAEYDTGAHLSVMLLSVPEGDDKPLKYPLMFQKSDALVITKKDALPYFDFDPEKAEGRARKLNRNIRIFPVSARTGDGMGFLEAWLLEEAEKLAAAGKENS